MKKAMACLVAILIGAGQILPAPLYALAPPPTVSETEAHIANMNRALWDLYQAVSQGQTSRASALQEMILDVARKNRRAGIYDLQEDYVFLINRGLVVTYRIGDTVLVYLLSENTDFSSPEKRFELRQEKALTVAKLTKETKWWSWAEIGNIFPLLSKPFPGSLANPFDGFRGRANADFRYNHPVDGPMRVIGGSSSDPEKEKAKARLAEIKVESDILFKTINALLAVLGNADDSGLSPEGKTLRANLWKLRQENLKHKLEVERMLKGIYVDPNRDEERGIIQTIPTAPHNVRNCEILLEAQRRFHDRLAMVLQEESWPPQEGVSPTETHAGRSNALDVAAVEEKIGKNRAQWAEQFSRRPKTGAAEGIYILDEHMKPMGFHPGTNLDPLLDTIHYLLDAGKSKTVYVYGISLGPSVLLARPALHEKVPLKNHGFKPGQRVVHEIRLDALGEIFPVATMGLKQFEVYLSERKRGESLAAYGKRKDVSPFAAYNTPRKNDSKGDVLGWYFTGLPKKDGLWKALLKAIPDALFLESFRNHEKNRQFYFFPQTEYGRRPLRGDLPEQPMQARMEILKDGLMIEIIPTKKPLDYRGYFVVPLPSRLLKGNALFAQTSRRVPDILALKGQIFFPRMEELEPLINDLGAYGMLNPLSIDRYRQEEAIKREENIVEQWVKILRKVKPLHRWVQEDGFLFAFAGAKPLMVYQGEMDSEPLKQKVTELLERHDPVILMGLGLRGGKLQSPFAERLTLTSHGFGKDEHVTAIAAKGQGGFYPVAVFNTQAAEDYLYGSRETTLNEIPGPKVFATRYSFVQHRGKPVLLDTAFTQSPSWVSLKAKIKALRAQEKGKQKEGEGMLLVEHKKTQGAAGTIQLYRDARPVKLGEAWSDQYVALLVDAQDGSIGRDQILPSHAPRLGVFDGRTLQALGTYRMRWQIDSLIAELRASQAPEDVAKNFHPGHVLVKQLPAEGEDSKDAKIRQALEHLHLATKDLKRIAYATAMLETLRNHPAIGDWTLLEFEGVAHRIVKKISGNPDAYRDHKDRLDKVYQAIYPVLREEIMQKAPSRRLRPAVLYAGIGNLFDLSFPKALRRAAKEIGVKITLEGQKEIAAEDLLKLMRGIRDKIVSNDWMIGTDSLAKLYRSLETTPGGTLLYFADNHGEFILDQILIEVLLQQGHKVVVVARAEPVRDDVTMREAGEILGQNPHFKEYWQDQRLSVVTDGSYLLGADLNQSAGQPEFQKAWAQADFYIAKGGGNALSLMGQDLSLPGFHVRMMKGSLVGYAEWGRVGLYRYEPRSPYEIAFAYREPGKSFRQSLPAGGKSEGLEVSRLMGESA